MSMSTATAVTMLDVRAGSGAITLPLTTEIPYRVITIKDAYGAAALSSITINTQGTDVFENGASSITLTNTYDTTTLYAGLPGYWYTIGGSRLQGAAFGTLSTGVITNPLRLGTLSTQTAIQFPGLRSNYNATAITEQTTGTGTQELLLYKASSISDQIRLQTTGNIVFEAGAAARSFPFTTQLATPTLYIAGSTSNVGVGTATPATTLDVAGTGRFQTLSSFALNVSSINGAAPGGTFNGSTLSLSTGSVYASNVLVVSKVSALNSNVYGSGIDTLSLRTTALGFAEGTPSIYFGASNVNYPLARIIALDQGLTYANSALLFQTATINNAAITGLTSFSHTGSNQSYTVPTGVTSLTLYMWGAGGEGFSTSLAGGAGAFIQGTLSVTPGQVLTIIVGGGSASTYGGGGAGAPQGGRGGGRSSIKTAGGDEIVIVGGGGGGAAQNGGGHANFSPTINGGAGFRGREGSPPIGGGGGTQTAGGAGGGLAESGSYLLGGVGNRNGGGGGAGYYGGGGGGTTDFNACGGGGGSSYTTNPLFTLTTGSNSPNSYYEAPATSSPYYVAGVGAGGTGSASGNGLVVIVNSSPPYILSETMRISKEGYVGIGTPTPQAHLDVAGTGRFQTLSSFALNVSSINGAAPGGTFNGSTLSLSTASVRTSSLTASQITASNLVLNGTETINFNGGVGSAGYGEGIDTLSLKSPLTAYNGGIASLFFGNGTTAYPLARIAAIDSATEAPGASALVFQTATAAINASLTGINIFTATGADQSYTVPTGVTSIVVTMWSAGGGGSGSTGGAGVYVKGVMAVTPGQTLKVVVGGAGRYNSLISTYGGGGAGGINQAASGGGRSALQTQVVTVVTGASSSGTAFTYTTSTAHNLAVGYGVAVSGLVTPAYNINGLITGITSNTFTIANTATPATITSQSGSIFLEILDAGGGGGSYNGGSGPAGNGGLTNGQAASTNNNNNSGGGSQTAGGQGGTSGGGTGSMFVGGNGGAAANGGGGGGGGWFGGGGGSGVGSGSGGSSYISYPAFTLSDSGFTANFSRSAPGTTDTYYQSGVAVGGAGNSDGGPGLIVIVASPTYAMGEAMRISRFGFVGVGTNNPSTLLDVAGTGRFQTLSSFALNVSSINGVAPWQPSFLISTTQGLTSNISSMIDPTELTSTVTGLGTAGFINTVGLSFAVASTAQGLGTFGYTSTNQLLSTTIGVYGAIGSNINTTVQPQFTSTLQGLGNAGYISTSQLLSTSANIIGRIGTLGLGVSPYVVQGSLSTNQTMASGADTIFGFTTTGSYNNNSNIDPQSWWNHPTSQLRPTVSGHYLVNLAVWWATATGNQQNNIQIRKNGNQAVIYQSPGMTYAGSGQSQTVTALVQMNGTTDYITFSGYSGNGVTTTQVNGTYFNAILATTGAFTGSTFLISTTTLQAQTISSLNLNVSTINGLLPGTGSVFTGSTTFLSATQALVSSQTSYNLSSVLGFVSSLQVDELQIGNGYGILSFGDTQMSSVSTIAVMANLGQFTTMSTLAINASSITGVVIGASFTGTLGTVSSLTALRYFGLTGSYANTAIAEVSTGIGTQELLLYKASSISDQVRVQTTGNVIFEAGVGARSWPVAPRVTPPTFYIAGSNSNVGVGTSNPTTTLDVAGTGRFQTLSSLNITAGSINYSIAYV